MLLRRPLRRVKFAQRRLRVFPTAAGSMPPASGRAPPAKRRRGACGNRLPHAEAHLLQLLLQDAAGGHEARRHGARAARLSERLRLHDAVRILVSKHGQIQYMSGQVMEQLNTETGERRIMDVTC